MRYVKQLIYGIFYLAFWSALIGGIYAWQKPTPSCFDGRMNGNEEGVDCGGDCATVCIPQEILPLESAGQVKMLVLGTPTSPTAPRVSLVAEILNRNQSFGASNFDYVFTILDRSGSSLADFSGNSFIYPGEIRYISLFNEALPAGSEPASARIELKPAQWTPVVKFSKPKLAIQSLRTSEANNNLVVGGLLINQDNVLFRSVSLTALFYDGTGNLVGVSGTERNNLGVGESREFALFHPPIPGVALERTKVFATAFNPR